MTTELSPRENAFLKLIDSLAKENTQLTIEIDLLRYNKRYTNTKYVKAELADPTFIPATKAKGITYVQEETKLKRSRKK